MTKSERNARKYERVTAYCAILEAIPVWYHNRKFKMHCDGYAANDNLAIHLFEVGEGPYCSLTVNIQNLPAEQFALDTNNFPEAEVFCIANRIARPTEQILTSGYCRYPVYELEPEIIKCCNKFLNLKEENTNGSKEDNKENK